MSAIDNLDKDMIVKSIRLGIEGTEKQTARQKWA